MIETCSGDWIDLRSPAFLFRVEGLTGEENRRLIGDEDRVATGEFCVSKESARGSRELESS